MTKLINRKKARKWIIITLFVVILISIFGGYEKTKDKVVEKASEVITKDKPKPRIIKYSQFGFRKLNRNSKFYLVVTDDQWSGWIDANTYGMKHRIRSLNGKTHLTKYKDGTVDTFRVADRRPPKEFVFKVKSMSDNDTLVVRTW